MDLIVEKVKVVELTLEDGSKMLCRGGEEETMQWVPEGNILPDGSILGW